MTTPEPTPEQLRRVYDAAAAYLAADDARYTTPAGRDAQREALAVCHDRLDDLHAAFKLPADPPPPPLTDQWTPGPWFTSDSYDVVDRNGFVIATVAAERQMRVHGLRRYARDISEAEECANGHMLAASLRMYGALWLCMHELVSLGAEEDSAVLIEARAARDAANPPIPFDKPPKHSA